MASPLQAIVLGRVPLSLHFFATTLLVIPGHSDSSIRCYGGVTTPWYKNCKHSSLVSQGFTVDLASRVKNVYIPPCRDGGLLARFLYSLVYNVS